MIFITQELYKEWKNKDKDIFNEIRKMNERSSILYFSEHQLLNDYDILNIILELEMKDLMTDVKNSYYFDTEGFIYEATKRLIKFNNMLDKRRKKHPAGLPFLFTDKSLIPLIVTALYDITVFNCWNDHRSLYDLICYIDVDENLLDPDTDQQIKICNIARWMDKCYRYARDYNPANRKLTRIIDVHSDHAKIIDLVDIYKISKNLYEKY